MISDKRDTLAKSQEDEDGLTLPQLNTFVSLTHSPTSEIHAIKYNVPSWTIVCNSTRNAYLQNGAHTAAV